MTVWIHIQVCVTAKFKFFPRIYLLYAHNKNLWKLNTREKNILMNLTYKVSQQCTNIAILPEICVLETITSLFFLSQGWLHTQQLWHPECSDTSAASSSAQAPLVLATSVYIVYRYFLPQVEESPLLKIAVTFLITSSALSV